MQSYKRGDRVKARGTDHEMLVEGLSVRPTGHPHPDTYRCVWWVGGEELTGTYHASLLELVEAAKDEG